jgi:hypothetical protein
VPPFTPLTAQDFLNLFNWANLIANPIPMYTVLATIGVWAILSLWAWWGPWEHFKTWTEPQPIVPKSKDAGMVELATSTTDKGNAVPGGALATTEGTVDQIKGDEDDEKDADTSDEVDSYGCGCATDLSLLWTTPAVLYRQFLLKYDTSDDAIVQNGRWYLDFRALRVYWRLFALNFFSNHSYFYIWFVHPDDSFGTQERIGVFAVVCLLTSVCC